MAPALVNVPKIDTISIQENLLRIFYNLRKEGGAAVLERSIL
jgi:hypothetical protein